MDVADANPALAAPRYRTLNAIAGLDPSPRHDTGLPLGND